MISYVGNFSCQSCYDVSTLLMIEVWTKARHQFVSDGHVDNVRRSQLELKRIDIDVTQHKSHEVILGIVAVLNCCRQHVDMGTARTSTLITAKPDTQLSNGTTIILN